MKTTQMAVVMLYVLACLGVGVYTSRRALRSEEEYWVAGRFLNTITGSFAILAVVVSASAVMGIVGLGYNLGVPFVAFVAASFALQFPLAAFLVAKPLREGNYCTIGDFFRERFGNAGVTAQALITVVFMTAYVVPQIKAAGLLGEWLLGIPYTTAAVLIGVTFTVYSAIGGMWAITITDIFQGVMVLLGTLALAFVAISEFGGLSILTRAVAARPSIGKLGMALPSTMGIALTWALWGLVAPMTMMRLFTVKDTRSLKTSLAVGTIFAVIVVGFGAVVLTSAAAIITPGGLKVADQALITIIDRLCPPWLAGVIAAGLFAAIMSTTDSLIFSVSAGVSRDVYKRLINPGASEKTVVKIGLVTTLLVGAFTTIIAIYPLPLISVLTAWAAGGTISAFMFPILLGLYWKGTTAQGAVAGIISGFAAFMICDFYKITPPYSAMLVGIPVSLAFTTLVSLASQPWLEREKAQAGVVD